MLAAEAIEGRRSLLREEDSRSEVVKSLLREEDDGKALVEKLPRGMLTAATEGLESSDVLKSVAFARGRRYRSDRLSRKVTLARGKQTKRLS